MRFYIALQRFLISGIHTWILNSEYFSPRSGIRPCIFLSETSSVRSSMLLIISFITSFLKKIIIGQLISFHGDIFHNFISCLLHFPSFFFTLRFDLICLCLLHSRFPQVVYEIILNKLTSTCSTEDQFRDECCQPTQK